jgi:hypothetical protein
MMRTFPFVWRGWPSRVRRLRNGGAAAPPAAPVPHAPTPGGWRPAASPATRPSPPVPGSGRQGRPLATARPGAAPAGHEPGHRRMQHERLTPGVPGGNDARLRAQILRRRHPAVQSVPHRLTQQGGHPRPVGQPQRGEVMGPREEHLVMVTGQAPRPLEGQPALGLELGAWWTRSMPTRVVPDAGHVARGTSLDRAPKGRSATLHDGARRFPDIGGPGMGLLIGRKGIWEDRWQGDERHRGLRTRGRRRALGCFRQYHANHPRHKRLVQQPFNRNFFPSKSL